MMRPRMFVTGEKIEGLRSLDEVRAGVQDGYAAGLWTQLVEKVEREMEEAAWTPKTPLPDREEKQIRHENREFGLVAHTANRIMDASLVALIKNERPYADAALKQIESVFDFDAWPEIEDKTHLAHGYHCSLRRGQLGLAIGLAYDWLHGLLTEEERGRIVEGFDVRFTQPFRAALEAGDRWVNWRQNFCSVIYGGFAIAGMAFGEDYSESSWLVDIGKQNMDDYLGGLFGPDGEFNESVQYAASVAHVTDYLMAERYHLKARIQPLSAHGFDAFCRWYMYFTFPPGRVASFGDPSPELPPVVFHYSALASALSDPVFQWFYLQYADHTQSTHRKRALELLYFDPTVEAISPEGRMALGRAYHDQGKLVSSRSSWDPVSAVSVVSSKAAREFNHSHADWGQVCLDGYGERLLIDPGSPPGYPKTDKDRYYNYQQWGHNVFVFGKNETGGVNVRERAGEITSSEFDDARGGTWTMDLTSVYDDARSVTRTVVHRLPRVLVVLDEARLDAREDISLRWHTCAQPELADTGTFSVEGDRARLEGLVERVDGNADLSVGQQAYSAPYDRDALGEVYPQRHEPYVEVAMTDDRCRVLSLFCTHRGSDRHPWRRSEEGWEIATDEGVVTVTAKEGMLVVAVDVEDVWEIHVN